MITHDDPELVASLRTHEGLRSRPYRDSLGVLTIGYGTNLEAGITERQAEALMTEHLRTRLAILADAEWFAGLNDARQRVILEMAYQLGVRGLLGFRRMIAALQEGRWDDAHDEALDSRWAQQTPGRARELAHRLRVG